MTKTDIQSAFRIIPIHPDDWELLGMSWKGLFFFDKALPFGLRSAPYLFNQLSDALEWLVKNHLLPPGPPKDLATYVTSNLLLGLYTLPVGLSPRVVPSCNGL